MAPITASAPKLTGASIELREPSLPVKLLTAGTAACVADLITFPLDTAKVRLQVRQAISQFCVRFIHESTRLFLTTLFIFTK